MTRTPVRRVGQIGLVLLMASFGLVASGSATAQAPPAHRLEVTQSLPEYLVPMREYIVPLEVHRSCEGPAPEPARWHYKARIEGSEHITATFQPAESTGAASILSSSDCNATGWRRVFRTEASLIVQPGAPVHEELGLRFVVAHGSDDHPDGMVAADADVRAGYYGRFGLEVPLDGRVVRPSYDVRTAEPVPGTFTIEGVENATVRIPFLVRNEGNGPTRFTFHVAETAAVPGNLTLPEPFVVDPPAAAGGSVSWRTAAEYRFPAPQAHDETAGRFSVVLHAEYAVRPTDSAFADPPRPKYARFDVVSHAAADAAVALPGLSASGPYAATFGLAGVLAVASVVGGAFVSLYWHGRRFLP